MGSENVGNRDPFSVLEASLQGGVTCFQFREKGEKALKGEEKLEFARKCQDLCKKYKVPFIVNDDVDLAVTLQADGVHIGQEDEDPQYVREKIGNNAILGISVHTEDEAKAAYEAGADYIGIGPVYKTTSKADAKNPIGTSLIQIVTEQYPTLPKVGIGGITLDNYLSVIKAGANGVAVISAIAQSENPYEVARNFIKGIQTL